MTFARFNPCKPCCTEEISGCVCRRYKFRAEFKLSEFGISEEDIPDLNFYVKDWLNDEVCWSGNPETTTLIWSQVDLRTQLIISKEYANYANMFSIWWNQPTDTFPELNLTWTGGNTILIERSGFDFDISDMNPCPIFVCGTNAEYTVHPETYGGDRNELPYYYAGYNNGDVSNIDLLPYYHPANITCQSPPNCCIDSEILYLIKDPNSTLSCTVSDSIELNKTDDKWIGIDNGIRYELSNCRSHIDNLILEMRCDETNQFLGKSTQFSSNLYPCTADGLFFGSTCARCNPVSRDVFTILINSISSICCNSGNNQFISFYLSNYSDAIVECLCNTPINKILYASFTNIPEGCPLYEDIIAELNLNSSLLGNWNSLTPLVIGDLTFLFSLSSNYSWIQHYNPETNKTSWHRYEIWNVGASVSGDCSHFPGAISHGIICGCDNNPQLIGATSSSPPQDPNCDPFQLIFNIDFTYPYPGPVFGRQIPECDLCNNFTITITE
jgi:hypothetical protein